MMPVSGHYEALSSGLASIAPLSPRLLPIAETSITHPSLRRTLREHMPCPLGSYMGWSSLAGVPELSAGKVHRVGAVSSHLTSTSRKNPVFASIACYSLFSFSI